MLIYSSGTLTYEPRLHYFRIILEKCYWIAKNQKVRPYLYFILGKYIKLTQNNFNTYSLQNLINLSTTKNRMFLNSILTDGYTCRVSFGRKVVKNELDDIELTLEDFDAYEVDQYFRPGV